MSAPARRRASYEDVLRAPPHLIAQVIDGDLTLLPRPAKPHARAATRLSNELDGPFDRGRGGPGGWIILFEPELHLAEDIVVPDLAGWRRERMPVLEDDQPFFTLAPDWICEVLSPKKAKIDRSQKLPIYARERVSHVWLVDPIARTLEILRREGSNWLLVGVHRDDAKVRAEPFDAVEIDLTVLWADVKLR
jgi:Uma2 family endonuclease